MTTASKQPDPNIGRSLLNGQFIIEQKIGSGGMGAVYRASQPAMSRLVAVKILHPKLANRKDLVSRFRREARAMSHLQHPNTVRVFLYGELEDGSLYIVMEYLEGKNLNQTVRREGPIPIERAIPVLIQVCGALQEAHTQGIVHRDLKPENIFLCTNGGIRDFPKVLDFGLAKVTERELRPGSIMLTQEGMVFGTPEFMSPEQAQGKVLDARSDIYSLAAILYEVLTGKLPFDAKTPMEFIQLHVTKPPISLDDRIPGKKFPPGLAEVVAKALQKKVEDRYASAAEFAEALKPFALGKTFSAMIPPSRSLEPTQADPSGVSHEAKIDGGKTIKMQAPPSLPRPQGAPPSSGQPAPSAMAPSSNPATGTPRGGPQRGQEAVLHQSSPRQVIPVAAQRPRSRGVSAGALVLVAVVCLILGIVVTVGVMYALTD